MDISHEHYHNKNKRMVVLEKIALDIRASDKYRCLLLRFTAVMAATARELK